MNATEQNDTLPYEPIDQAGSNPAGAPTQPGAFSQTGASNATGEPIGPAGLSQPGASTQPGANVPNPPQFSGQQPGGEGPRPARRHGWVGILATILGALLLVGIFGWTLANGIWQGSIKPVNEATSVAAAETLRVDVSYGEVEINFSEEATDVTLEVTGLSRGGVDPMTLTNTGSEVVLETRDQNSWFTGGPPWRPDSNPKGVLTLPAKLEGNLDLNISVGVGQVVVNGDLRDIQADVGAGSLIVNDSFETGEFSVGFGETTLQGGGGTATIEVGAGDVITTGVYDSVTSDVGLGRFTFDGTIKNKADFTFDLGDGDIRFVETMPFDTRIETNLGTVDIAMPQVPVQLEGTVGVRESAMDAGYEINGGSDAPQMLVLVELGDVSFH